MPMITALIFTDINLPTWLTLGVVNTRLHIVCFFGTFDSIPDLVGLLPWVFLTKIQEGTCTLTLPTLLDT